jgi:hypothetical protein
LSSLLQRSRDAVELLVDRRDLTLQRLDLSAVSRVERADRRATTRTLNERQFVGLADWGKQAKFKTMSAALVHVETVTSTPFDFQT